METQKSKISLGAAIALGISGIIITIIIVGGIITSRTMKLVENSDIDFEIANEMIAETDNEDSWVTYIDNNLGLSLMIPEYCGDPTLNEYYPYKDEGAVVQAIFRDECPLHSISTARHDTLFSGGDDLSFVHYETKIRDDEFNITTWSGLKGVIEYNDFFSELFDDPDQVVFRFNLNSKDYLMVNIQGSVNHDFKRVINSVEIK